MSSALMGCSKVRPGAQACAITSAGRCVMTGAGPCCAASGVAATSRAVVTETVANSVTYVQVERPVELISLLVPNLLNGQFLDPLARIFQVLAACEFRDQPV